VIYILLGHICGFIFPTLLDENILILGNGTPEKIAVYTAVLGFISFIEYQLFRSVKYDSLYWRGTVDQSDGSKFIACQLSYAFLASSVFTISIQNLLS
jgi:hypothetical protein